MSHGEFLNRIQRSLYYNGRKSKMSVPLSDYIAETFSETHNGYSLNRLNYSTIGDLRSTPCSLILALVYLERLKDSDPAYTKHVTPTELFLVSLMVATKFYSGHDEEVPYVNWAECMSTTSDKLLQMELAFLNAIDWKVYVSNEEFFDKVKSLEITLARRQGLNRVFFTYSELSSVMPSVQIAKHFIQSTLVLSLSYTVFVATMVTSVFLASQIPGTYLNTTSRTTLMKSHLEQNSVHNRMSTDVITEMRQMTDIENKLNDSDMDVILNERENRLISNSERMMQENERRTNTWIPISFSSWYNLLGTDFFNWPVITPDFNNDYLCDAGIGTEWFCNSTYIPLTSQTTPERFKLNLHGIRLKFV